MNHSLSLGPSKSRVGTIKCFLSLLSLGVFLVLCGCSENGYRDVRMYYFPIDSLEEGRVYVYKGIGPHSPDYDYWFYKSFSQNHTWYLTAQHYDANLNIDQFLLQEMLQSGVYSDSYTLFEKDSLGNTHKIIAQVEYGNIFPFKVKDSTEVFLFKIQWQDKHNPNKSTTLIRNRRFLKDTVWTWEGQNVEAIVFYLSEVAEFDEEGILEVFMEGREVYAKGLGLVYLQKKINQEVTLEFVLDTIMDMDQFLLKTNPINQPNYLIIDE